MKKVSYRSNAATTAGSCKGAPQNGPPTRMRPPVSGHVVGASAYPDEYDSPPPFPALTCPSGWT